MVAQSMPEIRLYAQRMLRDAHALPTKPERPSEETLHIVRAWEESVTEVAELIRKCDALIEQLPLYIPPSGDDPEVADLLAQVRAARIRAFDSMRRLNPDQAWFWTEEWQAGERDVDTQIATGRGTIYRSDEAFDAALDAMDRDANERT
jgi:hypothetical protein